MAIVATTLKKGQCIAYKGEQGIVLNIEHRTPGKGNALIMATIRSFQTGKTKDIRFASGEKVELVNVERQKLEFSYNDQEGYHLMDTNTYETITLPDSYFEGTKGMMTDGMEVEVTFLDEKPISAELPASVEIKVVTAPEGLKGDTATTATKEVEVETGLKLQAPLFVKEGDVIKIDTATGKYLSRV